VHEVRIGRFSLWLHDYLVFSCKASDGVRDLATELLLCSEVMLETARVKSVLIFLRKKKNLKKVLVLCRRGLNLLFFHFFVLLLCS
jgi:hypothetical protein